MGASQVGKAKATVRAEFRPSSSRQEAKKGVSSTYYIPVVLAVYSLLSILMLRAKWRSLVGAKSGVVPPCQIGHGLAGLLWVTTTRTSVTTPSINDTTSPVDHRSSRAVGARAGVCQELLGVSVL